MGTPLPWHEQVGTTAGQIWNLLHANGPMSMTQLVKRAEHSRDLVMQAVGWLAREGKLDVHEEGRSRIVSLR